MLAESAFVLLLCVQLLSLGPTFLTATRLCRHNVTATAMVLCGLMYTCCFLSSLDLHGPHLLPREYVLHTSPIIMCALYATNRLLAASGPSRARLWSLVVASWTLPQASYLLAAYYRGERASLAVATAPVHAAFAVAALTAKVLAVLRGNPKGQEPKTVDECPMKLGLAEGLLTANLTWQLLAQPLLLLQCLCDDMVPGTTRLAFVADVGRHLVLAHCAIALPVAAIRQRSLSDQQQDPRPVLQQVTSGCGLD